MNALWKDVAPNEIRYLFITEKCSVKEIASRFDVTPQTVRNILKGCTSEEERKAAGNAAKSRSQRERHLTVVKTPVVAQNVMTLREAEAMMKDAPAPVAEKKYEPAPKPQLTMDVLDDLHIMELQGKVCVYVLDCNKKSVEFSNRNDGKLVGSVDHSGLHLLIRELQQIEDYLKQA